MSYCSITFGANLRRIYTNNLRLALRQITNCLILNVLETHLDLSLFAKYAIAIAKKILNFFEV